MIRPIFRPSLAFTVAAYPTTQLTGSKLYPVVWNVIEALELDDLSVVAVTADGASVNRNFFISVASRMTELKQIFHLSLRIRLQTENLMKYIFSAIHHIS